MITGNVPSVFGRKTSARRITPSRILAVMSRSIWISYVIPLVSLVRRFEQQNRVRARQCRGQWTQTRVWKDASHSGLAGFRIDPGCPNIFGGPDLAEVDSCGVARA